ncbi:50S ribosomal protein L18 [Leptospira interrogans]|uniref:Large ribosomal subunit protein uL18 n=24 Tax=Leptospira TaxID=171 RepID=RL18_LEPIN|nr:MULTISPECIES: 50S ribosomal protein L18 [Leptospira]Q72NH7.1 RecName: Full=Large ribosomal subunit protein uL18; AltName: Full=50S ribosomal protein L18 [Leptospira interrogans serovar Copenhageni str. Fiocruz L1-130]Q9XD20.1 RecName: Full=Large ribosomal subunit protein uL18; AltName: Full=50S ribosomal protein L18 [Leptospira interrogans serovar Lai str. 56601]APH42637.1 50S ribosomal protein L18 [Leptospira interrogans serovar Copenhageni/Icterohaemorrhagiae]EMF43316.1 ribosomal protein L
MIDRLKKSISKTKRAERSRFKLKKLGSRPRLVFIKSNQYLSCQIIDDIQGVTLAYATTSEKTFTGEGKSKKDKGAAKVLGKLIAERGSQKGVKQVMLDRSGMIFHGRIAAFAEGAREAGLEF